MKNNGFHSEDLAWYLGLLLVGVLVIAVFYLAISNNLSPTGILIIIGVVVAVLIMIYLWMLRK